MRNIYRPIIRTTNIVLLCVLIVFALYYNRFPYVDDWSYLTPLYSDSVGDLFSWLFSQHVDHRIPLQKFIHYGLARVGGYDYRILLLFNIVVAFATSSMLIKAARLYRGRYHIGDILIPLVVLTPGAGYANWTFQLQFLSSIFCVSGSLIFFLKYEAGKKKNYLYTSALFLFAAPFCGMNGAMFSTAIVTGVLASVGVIWWKKRAINLDRHLLWSFSVLLGENILVWLMWSPSEAVSKQFSLAITVQFFMGLLASSTFLGYSLMVKAMVFVMLVVTSVACFIGFRRRGFEYKDYFLVLCLVASLLVALAAAVGRSDTSSLEDSLSHYRNLTLLIPILSWFLISRTPGSILSSLGTIFLLLIFGLSYAKNFSWRVQAVNDSYDRYQRIYRDLNFEPDLSKVVDKYASEFTWQETPSEKEQAVKGLSLLRDKGYMTYRLLSKN